MHEYNVLVKSTSSSLPSNSSPVLHHFSFPTSRSFIFILHQIHFLLAIYVGVRPSTGVGSSRLWGPKRTDSPSHSSHPLLTVTHQDWGFMCPFSIYFWIFSGLACAGLSYSHSTVSPCEQQACRVQKNTVL